LCFLLALLGCGATKIIFLAMIDSGFAIFMPFSKAFYKQWSKCFYEGHVFHVVAQLKCRLQEKCTRLVRSGNEEQNEF